MWYFQEISITLFFKNKHIFEKTCAIACSEIAFSKNSYHIETIQLTDFNKITFFTLSYVSEQTLILQPPQLIPELYFSYMT